MSNEQDESARFDSLYAPVNPSQWNTRLSVIDRFQHGKNTRDDEYYFFNKYRSLVIAIGRKKELSNDDIKELVSRVFQAVFEEFSKISAGEKPEIRMGLQEDGRNFRFKSWLTRIINNKLFDIYREYAKKGQAIDDTADAEEAGKQVIDESDQDINELWRKFLLRESLQELREKLSATQFRIFYQVKMKGEKGPKVAAVFRQTPDNVNQICSRAMKELLKIVESLKLEHPLEKYTDDELCRLIHDIDKEFQKLEEEFPVGPAEA